MVNEPAIFTKQHRTFRSASAAPVLNRPGFELTPEVGQTSRGYMKKYRTEFNWKSSSFLAGEGGAKSLARPWSVPEEKIRTWVSHYRLHGVNGLRPKRSTYSAQFKLQVLCHQDREQLFSRQVAAIYDIRNPNQIVVWRRNLDQGRLQAVENEEEERPRMKPERRSAAPSSIVATDGGANPAGRERTAARGGRVPKKLQALIRSKRSAAPTKRV